MVARENPSAQSARSSDHTTNLLDRAQRALAGGLDSGQRRIDPPRVFTRANGSRLWDSDGHEFVDFHAAFGAIVLGHANPLVLRKIEETLAVVDLTGIGVLELEIEVAERVQAHVPCAERVLFANSGSEATYHAIRLARHATGRRKIVKFQGCYHGWHDYVAANVISRPERVGTIDPLSSGMLPAALDELMVLPFNDVERLEETMRSRGQEIAAVILEPVIHTIGVVPAEPEFLASLRRTTLEQGALLIFDEVVTGFRHGLGGYQAICGVTPDLATFGKALANGFPLAAVAGRRDLMEAYSTYPGGPVFFTGTYNGHPTALAAAKATIEALEADDGAIHRRMNAVAERITRELGDTTQRLGIPARPVHFGSIFVCYFTDQPIRSFDDALLNDAEMYVGFHRGMIERGFLMPPWNLKRNHVMAAHTDGDIDRMLQAADDVLTQLARRRQKS